MQVQVDHYLIIVPILSPCVYDQSVHCPAVWSCLRLVLKQYQQDNRILYTVCTVDGERWIELLYGSGRLTGSSVWLSASPRPRKQRQDPAVHFHREIESSDDIFARTQAGNAASLAALV